MKKVLLAVSCFAFVAACGGNNTSDYDKYYDKDGAATETSANEGSATPTEEVPTSVEAASAATGTPALADAATDDAQTSPKGGAAKANYEKGAKLVAQSDCLACHKEQDKLVGPAYVEVAKKYEFNDKNVNYLADKIIKGGSGVWGQIPMSPHPNLSQEDAKEMAKYVLSLNTASKK